MVISSDSVFSVNYLFGEANFPRIFSYLKTDKHFWMTVLIKYNFRTSTNKFFKFNFSHFTAGQVGLFFVEKRNLKFSDSKM